MVDGLSLTGYSPAPASIMMDTEYHWMVTARDQYLRSTDSRSGRFTVHSLKARSSDGLLLLEIRSGMPPQGYLAFRDARTSLAGPVEEADRGLTGNRLVKAVSAPVWEARVLALDGSALPDGDIAATLTFTAPGAERAAAVDQALADIQHLKIARLDRSGSRWEIQPLQRVDAGSKSVSADVNGLSAFSVVASLPLSGTLSGLTAFPNPFAAGRETVRIRYSLLGDSEVKIRIYTPMGDLVRVLGCPYGAAGCGQDGSSGLVSEMEWDGRNGEGRVVANGMYTAEIRARSASGARKELLNIGVLK